MADDGRFAVVYEDGNAVARRSYTATAGAVGGAVTDPIGDVAEKPWLTVDANGTFTAAWAYFNASTTQTIQTGRQFTSAGTAVGPALPDMAFPVSAIVASAPGVVTVINEEFDDEILQARNFDATGRNGSTVKNLTGLVELRGTGIGTNGAGATVVAWVEDDVDAQVTNVRAQRLASGTPAQMPYTGSPSATGQTIEAEDYDKGGEGVGFHDLDVANRGGRYRTADGVDVEAGGSNGFFVGYGAAGEWAEYTVNVATAGAYAFAFNVRGPVSGSAAKTGGQFHADVDGVNKTGTLTISSTSTSFNTITSGTVSLTAGTHVVRVALDRNAPGDAFAANLDAFRINAVSTPTPTTTRLAGTTYGTAGSYNNAGNTIAKATDGNLATFFDAPTASGAAVGIDLGAAKTVTQIKFAPRSGYGSRMVGGVFQASNSQNFTSGVVTAYTVGLAPANGSLTTVTPSTATAYRYWRYVGPANGYCDVAEFQLYGAGTTAAGQLTGTTYGTPGSYQNNGNTVAKATDGDLSTYFDAPTASGAAVGIDLGSAKVAKQIKFAPRNGNAARMVGGVFQASNDANFGSGVVTVYTVGSAPASGSLTTVNTNTTTAYRYWRYVGPANGNCNVAEFQLFA